MINSLLIQNYQSHRDTKVEFAPGVNIFAGQSDCGKSAILRAINWLATNKPSGDAFRSDWGGPTVVGVVFDEGSSIQREKSDKLNEYRLTHRLITTPFRAMGQGVPTEVEKALNFSSVNTQYQMDSPFLLSNDWSPGRIAEYLNEVVGLDIIDHTITNINAKVRAINANLATEQTRLVDTENRRQALNYVDRLDAEVRRLENLAAEVSKIRRTEQELNALTAEIKGLREKIDGFPDHEAILLKIDEMKTAHNNAVGLKTIIFTLQTVIATVDHIDDELTAVDRWISIAPQIDKLTAVYAEVQRLSGLKRDISESVINIRNITDKLKTIRRATRAERLLLRTIELEANKNQINDKRVLVESLLGTVYEIEEMLAHNAEVVVHLEAGWKHIAPDICPLCSGSGRLR